MKKQYLFIRNVLVYTCTYLYIPVHTCPFLRPTSKKAINSALNTAIKSQASSGNYGNLPSHFILRTHGILDAEEVLDNIALAPVGDAVVAATSRCGVGAAGLADVQVDDAVAETVEGAVVRGPAVLDARVTEAHVVEELVFEVLQEHDGARLVHKVHVFVAVDVVTGGKGEEHVEMVGLFAHLADVFVKIFRAHLPIRLAANLLHQ